MSMLQVDLENARDTVPAIGCATVAARRLDEVEAQVAAFATPVVEHTAFTAILKAMASMHRAGRFGPRKARAMLISGLSGMGKSTLARQFAEMHPRKETDEGTIVPVLYVELPSQPTAKATAEAMLIALGDPLAHVGSAEAKQARVKKLLIACGVELLILDEMQHLSENLKGVARRIAADAVKNLLNTTGVPCVFLGAPTCVHYVVSNQELSRRCSPKISISPFSVRTQEQATEFKRLLVAISRRLPGEGPSVLLEPDLVVRLCTASFGLLGMLTQLVEEALRISLLRKRPCLTRDDLHAAFESVIFPRCPKIRNPFNDAFDMRPLIGPGEPYEAFAEAL